MYNCAGARWTVLHLRNKPARVRLSVETLGGHPLPVATRLGVCLSACCVRADVVDLPSWRPVSLARQQHLEMMLNGMRHACIDGRPAAGSTWAVGGAPPPALYVLPTGWRLYGMKLELFPCDTVAADSGARTMGKLVITVDYSRGLWVDEWRQAQNATAVRTSLRNTQLN